MKTNTIKYFIYTGLLVFLIACSTKRNTFISRNSHALSTKYNILYNGDMALDKGIEDVKAQNRDNFWEILPIERMQVTEDRMLPGENRNTNFERAETKATKAIQKHSMNIQGSEKNPQMDEAHLLLGKSRYYEQRFVPALEAFNYVLYKYPKSDKIYEVKIWREKTNMRLENDAIAVNNLTKLLKEIKFKDQVFADANAALAQAFLNMEEKDSAVAKIKLATEFTKSNEEKARYRFILAQLYEQLGYKDSAYAKYQEVIDMNRKASRLYVVQAHAKQAGQFDYKTGDTIAFLKKFNDLIEDRENRPYLDILHHQMGLFYDKKNNLAQAKKHYNISLKKKTPQDTYMIASNYRNLADIYFDSAKYLTAGKYFDSTLVYLKPRTREFNLIKKKRENLEDVIKYEAIAQTNDSIISLYTMSGSERTAYFEKHIEKLKKEEAEAQKLAEKEARIKENKERNDGKIESDDKGNPKKGNAPKVPTTNTAGKESTFYFYNPATVAYGQKEFQKTWGKRTLQDNWRLESGSGKSNEKDNEAEAEKEGGKESKEVVVEERFTPEFYIKQIPTNQTLIDSLSKERNFAYYQLGIIYKEKFKEYELAADKLERLLQNNPEERLILPSMYNLYKIYEFMGKTKLAEAMKARIITSFPDSRYAQILNNPNSALAEASDSPNVVYENLYKQYQDGDYKEVLKATEAAVDRFTGDEIVPKLELLKANIVGKLSGLDEYGKALNFVALTYPNSEEGKRAEKMISVDLPKLQALQLSSLDSKNWKILYSTKDFEDKSTKVLREKIAKLIKERDLSRVTVSLDIYTMTDNFVVIHGMNSEDLATGIATILKDYKDYKVQEVPIIISTENYTIVQIKKNIDEFLAGNLTDNPTKPNWDGTFEKPVVPQEKPVQKQEEPKKEMQKVFDNGKSPKLPEGENGNEGGMGLPPSPQSPRPKGK
ncbi:type IX secretion system periplasmic lipoprotein PorW/SprE [Flavobacterium terrisoli]|uniref:type IX secretion system periplasmic lipoprotein PorW/SprE n=1 Tax=Flavobacterium terrisoli TaxID=3242195 RepID=UPI002542844D|nr:tetratricopeptide repeat protein [Flavobacterium buctense]